MNNRIQKLYNIALKPTRLVVGLMSGTSMDGLDIALCKINGSGKDTQIKLLNFETADYTDDFRAKLNAVFAKRDADLQMVCLLNEEVALVHASLINKALKSWGYDASEIDLIASHGQTIFHAPKSLHKLDDYPNATLQIGDGDHIAVKTGIITVSDFRQKHIAAGGEGAPLAVYGDYIMFSKADENRIMLNIGGIANFTYLPGNLNANEVFSTDVGPGNTIMDQFMQKHYQKFYDEGANVAKRGNLNGTLLGELLNCDFFELPLPKTTGPELFNLAYLENAQQKSLTQNISNEDVMATLCHFSAEAIAKSLMSCFSANLAVNIYLSGGGMHNPLLVGLLKEKLSFAAFFTTEALNINPDAKEAVLFALLANETIAGGQINFGDRAETPSVCMGKICFSM